MSADIIPFEKLSAEKPEVLQAMQSSGCVAMAAIDLAALAAFMQPVGDGLDFMRKEKAQLDLWTAKLRDGGLPIDNDSVISLGMEKCIFRALRLCGADWFMCLYGADGINFFSWGSGVQQPGIWTYDQRQQRKPAPRQSFTYPYLNG